MYFYFYCISDLSKTSTFPSITLTFANPSILRVGSSPREKISLRMVDPTNVLIPEGRGNVTIIENDTSMASHTSTDRRESSSEKKENNNLLSEWHFSAI